MYIIVWVDFLMRGSWLWKTHKERTEFGIWSNNPRQLAQHWRCHWHHVYFFLLLPTNRSVIKILLSSQRWQTSQQPIPIKLSKLFFGHQCFFSSQWDLISVLIWPVAALWIIVPAWNQLWGTSCLWPDRNLLWEPLFYLSPKMKMLASWASQDITLSWSWWALLSWLILGIWWQEQYISHGWR